MVGYSSNKDTQSYFCTKPSNKSRVNADQRSSPKNAKEERVNPKMSQGSSGTSHSPSPNWNKNQNNRQTPKSKPAAPKRGSPQPRQGSQPIPFTPNRNLTHQNMSTPPRFSPARSDRSSPSRTSPSRSSPNNFASSNTFQPPTPSSLPKPPVHWTGGKTASPALDQSLALKLLLNVPA